MPDSTAYPNHDIERSALTAGTTRAALTAGTAHAAADSAVAPCKALVTEVAEDSPAYDAGFEPGCFLTSVDGHPLRDIIDWRWLTAAEEVEVGYIDLDGEADTVVLWRDPGEDWGFGFEGLVFDGVKQCKNACTFCFMHQLPRGMRSSLYLRDDDFRLSFLVGTFVTFTNLSAADEARIIEQRISPLRVSLQAVDDDVRARLIGKHAKHGIDALDRLLAAGIEFHAQVVLVPGENDGETLQRTLEWAYGRPGILEVGVVPLGYTKYQSRFSRSFNDPEDARGVLDLLAPFQARALEERDHEWVHAADEFYRNAYGTHVIEHLPPASRYRDFAMFEDGIGIIRSTVDDWERAREGGVIDACSRELGRARLRARMVAGHAQREFLDGLVERAGIAGTFDALYVENGFFGGNVDVTGLLTGSDMVRAIMADACERAEAHGNGVLYCVPSVVFNDDGLTLDGLTIEDMRRQTGAKLLVVSCSPSEYFSEILAHVRKAPWLSVRAVSDD